jgi:hypothetical protein
LVFWKNLPAGNQKSVKTNASFDENEITLSAMAGAPSVSDGGIFYINADQMLEFMDSESGKTTIVCNKANCSHEPYSKNQDTECSADVHEADMVIQQGANIYLIAHSLNGSLTDYIIYREEIDGTNRTKFAQIPDSMDLIISKCQADSNYLFMEYTKTYETTEDGQVKEFADPEWGFILYNLQTKESRIVSLESVEMADVSEILYINGSSLYEDGFETCVTGYDSKYSKEEFAKLKGKKREAYEQEHRNVYKITFELANPENYTALVVGTGTDKNISYFNRKLLCIQEDGTLLYTDCSKKNPSETKIPLEGVDSKTNAEQINCYGTDENYFYYAVYSKKEVFYYYCDLKKNTSSFACSETEGAIEGISANHIYFCYADGSSESDRKVVKSSEFRENGLGGDGKENDQASASETKTGKKN